MSKLERIIWHWSAGKYTFSSDDNEHYHFAIDGDAVVHSCKHTPEDNLSTSDGDYAAHVANLNTGSIGVAVCAMYNAVQSPFSAGECPIKQTQLDALIDWTVDLCRTYSIPVSRTTTLSHAEVQPTLGVAQSGKWDISWVPGMQQSADPVSVGDHIRSLITQRMNKGEGGIAQPDYDALEKRVAALEAWAASFSV